MADDVTSTANHGRRGRPWRRIRQTVLKREPYCRIGGPRCTRVSTTVDHVIPLSVRPDLAHVLTNLRGACGACNYAGGARITNAKLTHSGRRNGAYRVHKQARRTADPSAWVCPFHRGCRGVHSRPWDGRCNGTHDHPCLPLCGTERPYWCPAGKRSA